MIKVFFDKFPNADEVLKSFLFVIRRGGGLGESKSSHSLILFKKYKLKNQATSDKKNYQVFSSIRLDNVDIYL